MSSTRLHFAPIAGRTEKHCESPCDAQWNAPLAQDGQPNRAIQRGTGAEALANLRELLAVGEANNPTRRGAAITCVCSRHL